MGGKGNETTMQGGHVDAVDSQIQGLSKTLRDIQTESTYLWIRQKSHMKAVESIHYRVFWILRCGVSCFTWCNWFPSLRNQRHVVRPQSSMSSRMKATIHEIDGRIWPCRKKKK